MTTNRQDPTTDQTPTTGYFEGMNPTIWTALELNASSWPIFDHLRRIHAGHGGEATARAMVRMMDAEHEDAIRGATLVETLGYEGVDEATEWAQETIDSYEYADTHQVRMVSGFGDERDGIFPERRNADTGEWEPDPEA